MYFTKMYNSQWLSILDENNKEYLWMLGINLYKLPLEVRECDSGQRQEGKKINWQGKQRRVGQVYLFPQA